MPQTEVITKQSQWESVAAKLSQEPELAVDTEANSLYAYRDRICLIQIGTAEETFLVDPLAVSDLSSLGTLLADPAIAKYLHGSDYDLRSLDRDYHFRIAGLFDTQVAARFLGSSTPNLGSVLETFLGVSIPKSRQMQRSNWGLRPLGAQAIDYAASDVRHLVQLSNRLRENLQKLGRLTWVEEECRRLERVRFVAPVPPENAFFKVKGSDRLGPRELTVLKELFLWREQKAEQLDRPPFRVLSNDNLILAAQAATEIPTSDTELEPNLLQRRLIETVPELGRHRSNGSQPDFTAAVQRGLQGPLVSRPELPRRANPWTPECRERLQVLKKHRTKWGEARQIDPALTWPAPSLERMAVDPDTWRDEILEGGAQEVRDWQREEFGQQMMDALGVSS
ncbi:MAG: HRDC domain-containing protein [Chloroflexi bacterium]|nr:HRDC domain-containing protein [Chloroflexota bacterium]